MNNRLKLHDLLLSIGGPNVYYQVPSNFTMKYPCIKYSINKIDNKHANNLIYKQDTCYLVTVMCKDPDCDIVEKVSLLPKCRFDRHYVQDNIHHTIFELYY